MQEKDKKLIEYLEKIEKYIINYPDIEENLMAIIYFTDMTREAIKQIEVKEKENVQNHLTIEEVIQLAREILIIIDPSLVEIFNKVLYDGTLDFEYKEKPFDEPLEENETIQEESIFRYNHIAEIKSIDLIRQFNYNDVTNLIHEFMHYASFRPVVCLRKNLFTEYFSYYFEMLAMRYLLLEKHIPENELDYEHIIPGMKKCLENLSNFEYPYLSYTKFGTIDIEAFNRYFANYSKDEYEEERDYCLNAFQSAENQGKQVEEFAFSNYTYGWGYILAFWSLEHLDKNQVLTFYKEIYDEENRHLSLEQLLHKYGFHLTEKFPEEVKESIENFLALQEKNLKHL